MVAGSADDSQTVKGGSGREDSGGEKRREMVKVILIPPQPLPLSPLLQKNALGDVSTDTSGKKSGKDGQWRGP